MTECQQREIVHLHQPPNSSICGQVCIAMICNISIDEACVIVGHRRATTGKELHRALLKKGVFTSDTMERYSKYRGASSRCIARFRAPAIRASHWVLIWDNRIYDPYPEPTGYKYISGFLRIYERKVKGYKT